MSKKGSSDFLEVTGARVHNLKNIDVKIPREKLVVFTGLSGSGKSSLAFDTIYAEGQRRYIESFASYARQFLGTLERPDVDKISGLSPVISIEQKTVNKNPRSTVGTITEIYDFLRLLFARVSTAYSYNTEEKMVRYTSDEITKLILDKNNGENIIVLAPVVRGRKGHYRELFEQIGKQGFLKVRVDGTLKDLSEKIKLDRYKIHDIEIVIDQIKIGENAKKRLNDSIELSLKRGKGLCMIQNVESKQLHYYSKSLMCPSTGISYEEPAPNLFSFNSPYGACSHCNGLGVISEVDIKKIVPDDTLSIYKGGISPLGKYKDNWIFRQIEAIGKHHDFNLQTPIKDIPEGALAVILYGSEELLQVEQQSGSKAFYSSSFDGIINFIVKQGEESDSASILRWAQSFMNNVSCPTCEGSRLRKEANYFRIGNENISELSSRNISDLKNWFDKIETLLSEKEKTISKDVVNEVRKRIQFLLDVGLDYLSLNRGSKTLSGGEAQRIRLATQIGSQLVGVLYILDEPSIGLHQRDNMRLIKALCDLRDAGNSVIVVEHDKDIMLAADYIFDIGPGAGIHGGKIAGEGSPKEILASGSLTAKYLNGIEKIPYQLPRRKGNGKNITLKEASGHNLQNVSVDFPLGKLICVTGVSGSGKSSLIGGTLYPILSKYFYKSVKTPLPNKGLTGIKNIDKVIEIDQAPIGRTPRSNPATYTGVFSDIRTLFSAIPEAQIRGYKAGRFSFNVKGGRCETCKGGGAQSIEMNFLPDVYVQCPDCEGKRYNRETLEVRYKGKNINDVLNMTIDEAVEFFENIPHILRKIETLKDVGLGYVSLGQSSTTLSGGEAQRVKLATELSRKDTGNTFYILDEPTTGLHFDDIRILLEVLNKLVDAGNTILIIEHNLDVIKAADHIIDLGPDGGTKGGQVVAQGSPEEVVKIPKSITAKFLLKELN